MKTLCTSENKENLVVRVFPTKKMPENNINASQPTYRLLPKPTVKSETVNSLYYKYREIYIDWAEELCQLMNAPSYILHLASQLFDILNFKYFFDSTKFQALLLACLAISFKYNYDNSYLSLNDLQKHGGVSGLKSLEIDVLEKLDWKVTYPLSIDFIGKYSENNFFAENKKERILKLAFIYADIALRVDSFINKNPALIACTCIAFAQKKIGLHDYWNSTQVKYTGFNLSDLLISALESKYYSLVKLLY